MAIKYKHSYLTDGTKVKITEQLFNQLIEWENEGYEFHFHYIDLLKKQANDAINKDRVFYSHNTSLDEEIERKNSNIFFLRDNRCSIDRLFGPKRAVIVKHRDAVGDGYKTV